MKITQCKICEGIDYEEIKEVLSGVYYLSGWKLFVWKYFINHIYPDIEKGWKEHLKLIKEGNIAHVMNQNNEQKL